MPHVMMTPTRALADRVSELNIEIIKLRYVAGRLLRELQNAPTANPAELQATIATLTTLAVLNGVEPKGAQS